ncbi:terminase large subunit [Massilia antarctica]|uniref:terminase large subunit n=1 Tax=Massilia antarctica TaxID=2765360 RepID=UPI0006BB7FC0|nr:terminase large subunit [Massilia sp. H27-R4]MCY0913243.1 terminase large subunit [Massilia sp. H27-R4]CUI07868.1 Phage terminase, large subunit [Janthinobacterium sp. CG23_2]CUU31654.1 Phage terminase, large subunit [Janthinobacterium sp. CG23_2]
MTQSTACLDWERRIVARESLICFPPAYPDRAAEAWEIVGGFRLVDIDGHPMIRDVSLPWLREFVEAVFGSETPEGRRIINEFLFMVSKKNAKSTIAAAIMLCALIMNWRSQAELLILSPTKEIADNSYKPIATMIRADPELEALLKVQDHFRLITHTQNGATLKVVAADSDAVSGKKASFVFVDELHEFGKQARASNMLLEATGGLTSRPEGFVIYATTQSAEPPAGVFKDKLGYARKVRDGIVHDHRFLPIIYEFPAAMLESGAARDLNNAYVTNPNWGRSVDIERMTQLHRTAKEGDEGKFKEFLAKHLNIEIGLSLRSDRWAGADFWEAAGDPALSLDTLLERCEVAVVGVDGGGLDDLLGLAVIGRERGTGRWLHWGHAWAHRIVLERRKEIAPRLMDFQKDGDLTIVEVPGPDVRDVADIICRIRDAGILPSKHGIGVDGAGIGAVVKELSSREFSIETGGDIVAISQGWRLNGAIKDTERLIAGGEFIHCGRPIMAWSVSNARVEQQRNAISINKQVSGTAKIDPLMALFDAASLMALNPASEGDISDFLNDPISA